MQYQKNIKLDTSERSNFHRDNSNSNIGEMAYMDPIGNQQLISPISIAGGERSIDYNEKPKHRPIIQSVKNDIKNKTNLSKLVEENPIPSVIINMPYNAYSDNNRERSPRDLKYNLRKPKGENIYNIKTMNQKISPNHNIKNNYQTSTNPQFFDSHNFNNSSNDSGSGRYHQIIFDTRGNNISRSPQYLRRERGGIIPLNNMSPNLNNYDDNSYEQKNDIINNNYYYNRNIITTNSQRNISADAPLRFERQLNLNNNKINNIINQNFKYLNKNNINDEINNKYRNKINQNINYNDVKKIMKKFTKIYDPLKNKNGILVESSQVVLPGASDDVFTNRYKVLSKMKRLSNILLSKRKRSINKYKENSNLNKRSRSRTKSQSQLTLKTNDRAKSNSPFNKNMPHNKFLYVSLAMISSKGPNAEDRIILRKMRLDKGGVVDLAQEERKKGKYKIKKITKNKNNINFYHTNPKYREVAAKIIQSWWKELKVLYDKKLKKIILIQSVFRGKWVRKNMYDLLYLNYLYICFCRKIEKILSNYIRPYVFDKLFSYKIAEKDALRNIIRKKEKRDNLSLLSLYFNKWHSIIKNQNLKNKLGKQLIDIRKQNENKLNILLAFFNKWRYMTKISNIPKGKNFNIYPLHKINGLCKIMDAAKKYIQKKAIKKIIKQLIKYLSNQLRDNLLRKIISKKNDNTKNFLRNILYLWYSKILNCKKISNEAEAEKLREMRQKILKIILMNFIKHLNQRLLRKYFIRLYSNNNPESINKYLLYEILRKIDTQDLKKNKENIIDIKGKKYKIMKVKKDLKIVKIEDEKDSDKEEEKEDNEQIVDNYEKIIEKINKRKSGEYKEGEDIPEEIKKDLDKIDKNNKKKSLRERSIEKIQISQQEKKYSIKKIKKGKKKEQERDEISEEENEISNEESEDQRKNPKTKKLSKKISKPKIKYIETELNKRKSQPKYEELTPTSSLEQEEESSEPKEKIKYIKKSSVKRISEKREKPYKYIIKKRKSSPVGKRFIKKRKSREEKIPSRSQSEEFEEIEDSFEEGKYKGKHNYRRYSEPIKNRKFHPKRNTYKDNERSDDSLDEYQDKRNKKYIYIEEKPNKKKKHSYKNIIEEFSSDENEESPEEKKKRKSKYIYIKKDKDGNKYIEELISSPSSEEENKNRKRRKTQERPYIKKRKSDIHYNNKIDEVEENEENEDAENEIKKKKEKKKSILDNKINVYDENGNKINNLKKYQNKDGEYMIDLYDKKGNIINNLKKYFIQETNKNKRHKSTIEIYDKKGRRLLDLDKYQNDIDLYDKNGKIIKDIKKYENKKGEIEIPIYDENNNRITDLNKYKNEDGECVIDVYDKNGKIINDLQKYEEEQEENEDEEEEEIEEESDDIKKEKKSPIKIYDKDGKKIKDLEKHLILKRKSIKEKEKNEEEENEDNTSENMDLFDQDNRKILDLKKYKNKDGDIIIDVFNKDGKKIKNINNYKDEDGNINLDIYDKNGNRLIDLKKYIKEEKRKSKVKEIFDNKGRRLIDLEKNKDIELYDKNGKRITNLKKYINKNGDITIPIYDKNNNKVSDLKKYKNENGEEANVFDKNGKIINNLKNLENIEEEENEESEEKEEEEEDKKIDIYDKNGKIIKDLKKYENIDGEIDTPIYDKDKRRILDLKRYSTKDGTINIDVFNKDGNKIKNINNYKDEDGNIDIDIYDKNGNRLIDLKKYTKDEKRKSKVKEIFDEKGRRLIDLDKNKDEELFDENGKKITNLKKYINKNGDITIPLYDKNNNQVLDLKKYKNENGENANVYDKNGKIINNLKNYENIEEEEQEESEEESEEENEEKTINIYDKNGIIITDLKKYENNKGEIEMPIYDENNRKILDLKNYKNEDGDLNIDLYDKDGNKIKNINKFKDEDGNIIIDIYDKNGNRLIDLKKYIKEEKDKDDKAKYYDKEGNKITNLKKYKNEEGDITIPVYDKKGNRIIDLDNKQNELNVYDENGKKISNLKKYKNEDGEYNIALYDKEGNKIIDLKKYKKDENEKFKKRHSEMIRYKTKEGKYSSDIYDKRGSRITNLSQYKNKDGQITIPIYDAHRNSILSLERKSPKKKEYEQVNITRYNINPKDENKNLDLLTQQGEEYIPYYNKKNENSKSKIKPITLIGEKTELNKMVEKYNFLRKFNFSLNNLSEEDKKELIDFEPKKALLLDLLNDKEQKLKLFLWKYFCIWRGNAINKYNDLGDFLKFVKGQSLTNLRGDFIETLKSVKNPRLYSIALKKFLMNLFHKNIDLLRDAFNRWKKVIYKDNINSLKSKFFYSLCKQNDKKINEKDDGVSTSINNVDNLRKKKKINLSGPYPPEVKNILSLYFQKWRGARGVSTKKFFYGDRTLSLPDECKKYIFKKDKISEDFIKALLSNIPEKDKDEELKKFIKHPLRRMVVLRYRRERLNILRFLLRWYNKVRLILAINHLDRLVQGREKLTKLMRFKPSKILYKKMKLMNPKFYKSKGEKLIQILLDITKYRPFKKFINNMKLFNRVNQLNKILPKVNEKVSNYLLKKYLQKWKLVVEELKEQKIKLLLTYVKKKIKDEKKINHQRKNELLKRILLNLEKNKLNKLLLSFKVWHKIAKVLKEQNSLIREKEGNLLTIIKGKEKIINANYIKKGGEINIKLKKNEQGEFTIDDIINKNLTEEERQAIIKKKIPATINLIDDKLKSLLQMKLYKWKNITNKIICDKNARTIQKFIRIKLGNRLWKKRNNYFGNLSKKYLMKKIGDFAKINRLNKTLKKLLLKKILDNLRKNSKDKNCIISLNENIINANDELRNKNKKIAMKQILKLYTYITLKKLFENLKKMQRSLSNKIFAEFLSKLKEIKLIKSEYNYEKQISNEAIPYRKKMSFAKKKSSSIIQQKEINKSIPYISLLPHLMKFLDEKIRERKTYVIKKLNQSNKAAKLYNLFSSYINKKLIQDKKDFFKIFIKSATKDEKQNDLYKLLRKYFITKKLFVNIEGPSRLLKIFYLIKLTVINQDISDKRWLRALIRKWRFLSFSKSVFKNKMSILYKNFHVNYLEMVNDVFGEEERDNPSVIKEFERFGSNVGMWENEHPDFVEESKFCKNVQKKFKFYRPKEWESRNSQIKIEESKETNEEKDVNEINEIKKDKIKKYEEVKENNNITEEKKAEPKEPKRKYFRRSFKQNK